MMWTRWHSGVVSRLMETFLLGALALSAMAWCAQCSHGRLMNEATMTQLPAPPDLFLSNLLEIVDPQ